MFDNFGLSEFFFLAVLALLFFGPERLPQIGARVGRWVTSLTQYSKAFMNQWREEALVIQEAVDEVRGIRDEIRAAQAEIASTLETARDDVSEGLEAAQEAFGDAKAGVTGRIAQARQSAALGGAASAQAAAERPGARSPRDDTAIAKTQQVVDDLMKKRAASAGEEPAQEMVQEAAEEDEYTRNLRAIQEIQERDAARRRAKEMQAEVQETAKVEPEAAAQAGIEISEAKPEPEAETESAYDKTQRVLDELRKKRATAAEEEKASTAQPTTPSSAAAEEERAPAPVRKGTVEQPIAVQAPESGVSYSKFTQLSIEVGMLKKEIRTLRDELNVLRADARSPSTPARAEQVSSVPAAEPGAEAVAVEEAA